MPSPASNPLHARPIRVLAVVDWSLDPEAVADTLRSEGEREAASFALLVPSRLHGFDWIGNPKASRPCAQRQLEAVRRSTERRGMEIETASVGDPERVPVIGAFLEGWDADRVVIFDRERLVAGHPFSVRNRVARKTRAEVERIAMPVARRRAPRCASAEAAAV